MSNKALILLILSATATCLNAQQNVDTGEMLTDAFKKLAFRHEAIPVNNEKLIRAAAMKLLEQVISFGPDGTARTTTSTPLMSGIEWEGLTISKVQRDTPTSQEQMKGAEACYYAWLTADKHRIWDKNRSLWSEWRKGGYAGMSSAVRVMKVGNTLIATAPTLANLKAELPVNSQQQATNPTTTDDGLPPGVTRRKK